MDALQTNFKFKSHTTYEDNYKKQRLKDTDTSSISITSLMFQSHETL